MSRHVKDTMPPNFAVLRSLMWTALWSRLAIAVQTSHHNTFPPASPPMRTALLFATLFCTSVALAQPADSSRGDKLVGEYFARETERLEKNCLAEIKTLDDWNAKKGEYRRQLFDMLGLDPLPPRSELHAATTGKVEHEEFTVENVHFQSSPKLYVTGNLYLPKKLKGKAPAILYLCGHGAVKKNGVSYGNKVHYQHHGAWYARHGYVCLIIDSLQLGEIEGLHHGLYREKMWWWTNRGYTPAGIEAWNCIRALDYLQSRPEVDGERLGATGRSGGGAYSWWIAALDERIKAAVPVAGITDLRNHVIDGCIEGHCDCMYFSNTYEWDYPLVAALVAPRPLVVSNTDSDGIFPLDGVYRTYVQARRIYALHKAADKIAFNITAGGHQDTQELQMQAFRWFDQHLMKTDRLINKPAEKFFEMEQLQVFKSLPDDQINTKIQETWIPAAPAPPVPSDQTAWHAQRDEWVKQLNERVFRPWLNRQPEPYGLDAKSAKREERDGLELREISQEMPLFVLQRKDLKKPKLAVLNVLDDQAWQEFAALAGPQFPKVFGESKAKADEKEWDSLQKTLNANDWAFVYFAPTGYGLTKWNQTEKTQTHIRRRFILLGQTHDAASVQDVRRAVRTVRELYEKEGLKDVPLWLQSQRQMAGVTLMASLFEPNIARLDLYDLPPTLHNGPYFFNVERYLDMPQLVALAAERSRVVLYKDADTGWEYPRQVAEKLGWEKKVQLRKKP
jgi:hypothetical protein